jgi:putative iron-only hydrogenase system regulator
MNKTILATISILIKDRHHKSDGVNRLLTEQGHLIKARLGINLEPKCSSDCLAVISLVTEGAKDEIDSLVEKLNGLSGIEAQSCIIIK